MGQIWYRVTIINVHSCQTLLGVTTINYLSPIPPKTILPLPLFSPALHIWREVQWVHRFKSEAEGGKCSRKEAVKLMRVEEEFLRGQVGGRS